MQIRPATPADVAAMQAIEVDAGGAAHWGEQEYKGVFSPLSKRLAVVADEGGVRGFLVAQQIGPEWELENIAVAAGVQRRGLGAALLLHFLSFVRERGGAAVYLEVRASNVAARALYEKHGFIESGRRPTYYQQPEEDAVLYTRNLAVKT